MGDDTGLTCLPVGVGKATALMVL